LAFESWQSVRNSYMSINFDISFHLMVAVTTWPWYESKVAQKHVSFILQFISANLCFYLVKTLD